MNAKRLEMFYGESGTGKSEGAAAIAKQAAEEAGLPSRALIGDGSKATYHDAGLVDAGVMEVFDYTTRPFPLTTFQQIAEGYWPADVTDPTSPMLPLGHKDNPVRRYGAYIFEGLSVGALYVMGDNEGGLSYRSGKGEKIGQDSPVRVGDGTYDRLGKFQPSFEGAKEFGANPPSHYGFTQRRMLTYVDRSKVIPAEFVIWTAHQKAVEDKLSKEIIVGPEVAGDALTRNLQRIFNNTWHFAIATKRVSGKKDEHTQKAVDELDAEYRVYTRDHFDSGGTVQFKFKAVTRGVSASELDPYYVGEPGEAVLQIYGLVKQKALARATATKAAFEAKRGAAA